MRNSPINIFPIPTLYEFKLTRIGHISKVNEPVKIKNVTLECNISLCYSLPMRCFSCLGVPGVKAERYTEAMNVQHCALSLVGKLTQYLFENISKIHYTIPMFLTLSIWSIQTNDPLIQSLKNSRR